jgi:2-C-methyl-D-erythritol 4-phosphate cytidylyltransferase
MRVALILPAAGASSRYQSAGGLRSKLDEDLGGKPLLQRTVEVFTKYDDDDVTLATIIVAGPHDPAAYSEFRERHADRLALLGAQICPGGKSQRWETVAAALALVPADCTHIAVHDAARPCVSHDVLRRIFRAAHSHAAVVPAIAVSDTVKRVRTTEETMGGDDPVAMILGESAASREPLRVVEATLDRSGLVLVQTPQVFEASLLRRAYAQHDRSSTDDAGLVERLAEQDATIRVVLVDGDPRNIKVTLPADLSLARAILGYNEPEAKAAHKRF